MRVLVWKWLIDAWHPEHLAGLFRLSGRKRGDPSACNAALIAVDPVRSDAIAVVVVAEAGSGKVRLQGNPLPVGMSAIRDRTRIDLIGESYWVSAECMPRQESYDPQRHGPDVRCFMTKARLRAAEPITICTGNAAAFCGTIYRRKAWLDLLARPGFRCPNCSCDPQAELWKPPAPVVRPPTFLQLLGALQEARR